MVRHNSTLFIFFAIIGSGILFPSLIFAQDRHISQSEPAESYFAAGIRAYDAGNFRSALQQFDLILDIGTVNQRTTAAYLMSSKSMIELGQNRDAIRRLRLFLDRFPRSSYQDDAYFTLGVANMRERRYDDALFNFLRALASTDRPGLAADSEPYIEQIIDRHLTLDQIRTIHNESRDEFERGYLALALAQRYIERGNINTARVLLERAVEELWQHPLIGEMRALLDRLDDGITLKIGAILPMFENRPNEPIRNLGREIYQGIQFAIDQHNAESEIQLYLDVRDSQRQPSLAARHVQDLVNDSEVIAILGPVFSDEAFATAGVANARGVPIITPTATANHIAAIGRYVFQTNPDYRTRGRAMARFAVEHLGYRNLAVLAPIDSHGQDIAEGFMDELRGLDEAFLVVNEWYRSGETNFRQQFYNIRSRGLLDSLHHFISFSGSIDREDMLKLAAYGIEPALLDSLTERESAIPVLELLGEDGIRIADSLGIAVITGDYYADSLDVPVESIDAIFLPITSKDEMGIVSAQIAYYNIQTQLLGTGEWYDFLALEENRRYVNGVYFTTDAYWDTEDSTFITFFDSFMERTGSRPNKNTMMGYDTMKLISMLIREGATTRDAIAGSLASGVFYRGIHSPIVVGENRVNAAMNILRYIRNQINKVDEIIIY
jgi:branched-chain amino acid transport system substrate-binding protein